MDMNGIDTDWLTGFHMIIIDKLRLEHIECLLDKGADVNARDKKGKTALHYLCYNRQRLSIDVVRVTSSTSASRPGDLESENNMAAALDIELSAYGLTLKLEAKERYIKKITSLGFDPYNLDTKKAKSSYDCSGDELPDLTYPDIYHYLIDSPLYSHASLKAYKSLEAYKYSVAGWVRNMLSATSGNKFVFRSQVLHSQRLSEKPLEVWVAIQTDGVVVSGHCTCMAGLGEVCSHVGATLFSIDGLARLKKGIACTSLPNSWALPSTSSQRAVQPMEIAEMDFTNKRKLLEGNSTPRTVKRCPPVAKATEKEIQEYYDGIKASGINSPVLMVLPQYNKELKMKRSLGLPDPLPTLYDEQNLELSFPDLVDMCEVTFSSMSISCNEAKAIEQETRQQASSKVWFRHRAGRITASNMKAATRTNVDKPAPSLIKRICYPETFKFKTKATSWGCEHEMQARNVYELHQKTRHQDFSVSSSGFVINPAYPHLGASPDGVISCNCCGEGVLEIKCPFCLSDKDAPNTEERKNFCLQEDATGLELKKDHQYFYQIQTQMHVCEKSYCDFVVWGKDFLHIERINADKDFWDACVTKASDLYIKAVLPELLGKWFTLNPQQSSDIKPANVDLTNSICYCRRIESGTVIECKSGFCKFVKFHLECLRLKNVPKTKWLCCDCRKLMKKNKT